MYHPAVIVAAHTAASAVCRAPIRLTLLSRCIKVKQRFLVLGRLLKFSTVTAASLRSTVCCCWADDGNGNRLQGDWCKRPTNCLKACTKQTCIVLILHGVAWSVCVNRTDDDVS